MTQLKTIFLSSTAPIPWFDYETGQRRPVPTDGLSEDLLAILRNHSNELLAKIRIH
jgi:hypothetical protein